MEFVAVAGMASLVYAFGNFLKHVTNQEWNGVITQLVIWASGAGVVLLFGMTTFAEGISIGEHTLAGLSVVDKIVFGMTGLGSTTQVVYDFKKAVDHSDTAVQSKLLPPS